VVGDVGVVVSVVSLPQDPRTRTSMIMELKINQESRFIFMFPPLFSRSPAVAMFVLMLSIETNIVKNNSVLIMGLSRSNCSFSFGYNPY
jgi:hypothetical protein